VSSVGELCVLFETVVLFVPVLFENFVLFLFENFVLFLFENFVLFLFESVVLLVPVLF
jgi:hypothetical protein